MPSLDYNSPGVIASIVAGVLSILAVISRYVFKTFKADKLEGLAQGANVDAYIRLQQEIERLTNRVTMLEERLWHFEEIAIQDAGDLGMLGVVVCQMPCGKCELPSSAFMLARLAIKNLRHRRGMDINGLDDEDEGSEE